MIIYSVMLTLLFFNSSTLCAPQSATPHSCEQEALLWCSALKHEKLSGEDKIVLLNVTYWSWARSAMIMQAQKAVAHFVRAAHALVQTSMSGRMNPARLCDIAGCTTDEWRQTLTQYEQSHNELVEKLKAYRYASATYAQCLEYILKTDHASHVVVKYTQKVREQARVCLVDTLEEHALSIDKVIDTLSKVFDCVSMRSSTRGIVEVALQFADLGIFNSFAKFDKKYCQCNEAVWNTLAKSYTLSNIIWDMSEQARVDFYRVHHRMLMRALYNDGSPEIASAFNPDGFVAHEQRKQCITVV